MGGGREGIGESGGRGERGGKHRPIIATNCCDAMPTIGIQFDDIII